MLKGNAKVVKEAKQDIKAPLQQFEVKSVEELDAYFEDREKRFRDPKGNIKYDDLLKSLVVVGDTQIIGSKDHPDYTHPVVKLLHERRRSNSTCTEGPRPDGFKVALVIEGGGMRGCISTGMVAALYYLGLEETVDVVYGSSAGTVIGSYFITRQVQWFGTEIYYDILTTAGNRFIDSRRLLRALGLGLMDPRLIKDVITRPRFGKPVLNLDYLLDESLQKKKPLDWENFKEMQKKQPLKVIASSLHQEKAIVLDMERGNFDSIADLARCMHASCLLPGIAGPVMNINKKPGKNGDNRKMVLGNNLDPDQYEPLADALMFEPMAFQPAVDEGATHVVVLRTRPDGSDVSGKSSIPERMIFRRFFRKKNNLRNMYRYMRKHLHKRKYAESVLALNKAATDDRDYRDTSAPHLMTVALPPGSPEIARLENRREVIFDGVRRGFARAYDALVEDPAERGRGAIVAKVFFPDEILKYDPLEFNGVSREESAFSLYLRKIGEDPEKWRASGVKSRPVTDREPR
jgi:predicted acylesterase/phospholipase RssA